MPTEITLNQLLIFGLIVGFVIGLVPLVLGFTKQNRKYGLIGFVLTIIGGAFFSFLGALPVSAVFSWLILRKPKAEESKEVANTENTSETPISGD